MSSLKDLMHRRWWPNHIARADPGLRQGFAEKPWIILNPSPGAARLNRWKTDTHMKFILFLIIGLGLTALGQSTGTNATHLSTGPTILQRIYRVDTNDFTGMRLLLKATNKQSDIQVLRSFLKQEIHLSPPSTFFYTDGQKALLVRSTKESHEKIERFLAEVRRAK
jgi:hypothetical protein